MHAWLWQLNDSKQSGDACVSGCSLSRRLAPQHAQNSIKEKRDLQHHFHAAVGNVGAACFESTVLPWGGGVMRGHNCCRHNGFLTFTIAAAIQIWHWALLQIAECGNGANADAPWRRCDHLWSTNRSRGGSYTEYVKLTTVAAHKINRFRSLEAFSFRKKTEVLLHCSSSVIGYRIWLFNGSFFN